MCNEKPEKPLNKSRKIQLVDNEKEKNYIYVSGYKNISFSFFPHLMTLC